VKLVVEALPLETPALINLIWLVSNPAPQSHVSVKTSKLCCSIFQPAQGGGGVYTCIVPSSVVLQGSINFWNRLNCNHSALQSQDGFQGVSSGRSRAQSLLLVSREQGFDLPTFIPTRFLQYKEKRPILAPISRTTSPAPCMVEVEYLGTYTFATSCTHQFVD